MKHPRIIAVFQTTHATLQAEKALKEAGLDIRTTIKPPGTSPGCKMALTMPEVSMSLAARICAQNNWREPAFHKPWDGGEWIQIYPSGED